MLAFRASDPLPDLVKEVRLLITPPILLLLPALLSVSAWLPPSIALAVISPPDEVRAVLAPSTRLSE